MTMTEPRSTPATHGPRLRATQTLGAADLVLEPLSVFDTREDGWANLTEEQRYQVRVWAVEHDIDPGVTYRMEVYLLDCLFVRVFQYVLDGRGTPRLACTPGPDCGDHLCVVALADPFDRAVASMPPVRPGCNG